MKNDRFHPKRGRRSIRVGLIWTFVFSLVIAIFSFNIVLRLAFLYVDRFQLGFYFYNLPIVAFVLAFIISFYQLTRRMVNYLIALADGLQIISEGNLDYRVPIIRKDELGQVAMNINLMTERLQRQMEKERKIESSKMDLITGVSHDLRTPLTSIIGYLELLRTDSFQNRDEYTRFVQNTYSKAVHLKKLIDDLFEYTRLTTPDMQLDLRPIDVHQLLEQMLFEFEPLAQENGIQLVKEIDHPPVIALMDSGKFARAIDNLLMNALKYSVKPGTIQILLRTDPQRFYIEIENKGQPLTEEQEDKLFDRFYKVDHSRSSEGIQNGTGLGLSIARNIIERHGGTLTLTHRNGIFVFTIGADLNGT
ncbi:sensor histidine kinase [Paenibacillus caseinilyticus]|uniref:histidine kinase n=1 Tax=Paenibacillus mucilaginosus K02 TaxID=997761 RepID=I0BHJ6_9BACL|nr:HAMP domain-containing sensor histidine kinase [Paenibacillus mucilaginosus]AFH61843.1 histidine kinase [Paenibacillus mucilaginosus K02]